MPAFSLSFNLTLEDYYGPLANLLNEIGSSLKPSVFCVVNLRNRGAGIPDGGLFTEDQQGATTDAFGFSQKPARGVLEAKPTGQDIQSLARSEQVRRYLDEYGQVLVTNLREFMLVTQDSVGNPQYGEVRSLAADEVTFWSGSALGLARQRGDELYSFLRHVMLSGAPLTTPKDVANVLAFYAREALFRIEKGGVDLSVLDATRRDFESGLGIAFEGEKGDHFFHSALVQTLFYGIFSAWVLWHEQEPREGESFDWRTSAYYLHVPVIQGLFERLAVPTHLQRLDLMQVLEWTGAALNRVNRVTFFAQFNAGEAVQYFYEPFLEAFDPELRKALGVWYTPPEIVEYMVERVDRVLRDELGIADGLADRNVYVLDPACGTGAYLVAVLRRIYVTLEQNYGRAAAANVVREAIRNQVGRDPVGRVFGFEILAASFVVAHLQMGLVLQRLGVPLADGERAGVYLTNSLTGWLPPSEHVAAKPVTLPTLGQEREEADSLKRGQKILVVLGNPPYNAFAGTTTAEESIAGDEGLVDRYKRGLRETWGIKKYNLDDLYIRFFRIAERFIAEMRGKGVVCFISNSSWVGDKSFVVLRQCLLESFDRFWLENMHGDRTITEYAPDGRTSETIFAIPGFSLGIRQGVVISTWVKNNRACPVQVLYNDHIDDAKAVDRRRRLLMSLGVVPFDSQYDRADPSESNYYSFLPRNVSDEYGSWPLVTELCAEPPMNGLMEKRGGALIDIDRDALERRMRMYFDTSVSWDQLDAVGTGLTRDAAGFDSRRVRPKVQASERFSEDRVLRYALRPFDARYCYYSGVSPLWNRARPDLWAQQWQGNEFFVSRSAGVADPEGVPVFYTGLLGDNDFQRGHSYYFPVRLRIEASADAVPNQYDFFDQYEFPDAQIVANLSSLVRTYLATLGITDCDTDADTASLVWLHALAIGYAPQYLEENADGIAIDWPRIPLPDSADLLYRSAELGRQIALLLDTDNDVIGVTSGRIREELRLLGWQVGGDLHLTASWGYLQRGNVVMPGLGNARQRAYRDDELAAMAQGAEILGLGLDDALALLGDRTYNLYVNATTCWSNVPANVYEYVIGGYQVIKKWLSYRQIDVLGRALRAHEAREVTHMVRRIAAIILLQPALNANYRAVKEAVYRWYQ
jgi:hypothetical protein